MIDLPAALRVPLDDGRLEAGGRRAHAVMSDGVLHVTVGGAQVTLELDPALPSVNVEVWPFAARSAGDTLFAATDQPVVALDRTGGATVRVRRAGGTSPVVRLNDAVVEAESRVDGNARIVVHAAVDRAPDVDALMAGAIARARRRAAMRPRVALPGTAADPIAIAEHRLRLALAARGDLDARARALAALALLAMNDPKSALETIRDGAAGFARDAACAVVVCGAWSAWRGTAIDASEIGRAARGWHYESGDDDAWARAARSLAPYCGDLDVAATAHARNGLDPAKAIADLTAATAAPAGAAELLNLLHGTLGVMPDATRGRVRLAPRLAPGVTRIDQLFSGDATLFLVADVADERASIDLEQSHGATPFTAILEPWLPAGRLREARIEDTRAELDTDFEEGGIRPRVQLIIDRRRTLVLFFDRC